MGIWGAFRDWWRGDDRPDPGDDFFARYDAERRAEDPDYDEKRRTHVENLKLRERRDLLAKQEHNIMLREEIAELEERAKQRASRDTL